MKKILLVLALFLLFIVLVVSCIAGTASTSNQPTTNSTPTSPEFDQSTQNGKYNQVLRVGDIEVKVTPPKKSSNEFTGSQYCTSVSYYNVGQSPEPFNPFDWKFQSGDGVESDSSIPFNSNKALRSGQLAPGGKVSGDVCSDDSLTSVSAVVYSPGFGIAHKVAFTK